MFSAVSAPALSPGLVQLQGIFFCMAHGMHMENIIINHAAKSSCKNVHAACLRAPEHAMTHGNEKSIHGHTC